MSRLLATYICRKPPVVHGAIWLDTDKDSTLIWECAHRHRWTNTLPAMECARRQLRRITRAVDRV